MFCLNNKIHFFFTCAFAYKSICFRGKLHKITPFAYLQLNNKQTNELSRYLDRANIRSPSKLNAREARARAFKSGNLS